MSTRKEGIRTFLRLVVAEHGLIAVSTTSAGILLGYGGIPPLYLLVLPNLIFCAITYGLNAYNALSDVGIDAINKPYRPIQKGCLTKKEVFVIVLLLYAGALYLALQIGHWFLYMSILAVVLGVLYSAPIVYLKKRFLVGNLLLCVFYAVVMPIAGFSYVSEISKIPLGLIGLALLLALPCAIFKDFEDYAGDKKYGINTIPVTYSISTAKKVVAAAIFSPYILVMVLVAAGLLKPKFVIFSFLGLWAVPLSKNLMQIQKFEAGEPISKKILLLNVVAGLVLSTLYLTG